MGLVSLIKAIFALLKLLVSIPRYACAAFAYCVGENVTSTFDNLGPRGPRRPDGHRRIATGAGQMGYNGNHMIHMQVVGGWAFYRISQTANTIERYIITFMWGIASDFIDGAEGTRNWAEIIGRSCIAVVTITFT